MASTLLPIKNSAYTFYVGLRSQADVKLLKANPTLATGDFKVSIDGGSFANLGSLPTVTPASGTAVKIVLTAGEMNGDRIIVTCIDASGAEWCDLLVEIATAANGADASTPQTGDSFARIGAAGAGLTAVGDTAGTTTLLTRITALVQTKAEADTAHGLLATATALSSVATSASNAASSAATAATQATTAATQTTATAIRAAVGLATANLDTQIGLLATAAKLLKYVQLMVRKDAAIATDNAVELMAINASGGSGAGAFASTTDSQEGIRDAISAGSASAEDIAAELVGIGAYVSAPSSTPAVGSLGVFVRATTWIMPAISVGALPVDREKLWFTVKTDPGLDDSAAILMVEETDGLLVLNGEEADDDTAASITYDDVDDEVTPRVETAATAAISPRGCLYFDVKYRAAGGADHYQVASGTFAVVWPITNAT